MTSSLIKNGTLHDGRGNPARSVDVRIVDGVIAEIGENLAAQGASQGETIVDATDLMVAPGLIDLHVHVFSGIGLYSVDPIDAGLRTGVTTMLDTGTAGSLTYRNFERFIAATAAEDIYALLNISMIGAIQGHPDFPPYMGDLNDGRHAHVPSAVECARNNPKQLVGMKVRLTSGLANYDVKNEWAGFHGVFEAASELSQPCMIHHAGSQIPLETLLKTMRPGDIYTHLYHPNPDRGFDPSGRPFEAMLEARSRGVVFDVGHGVGAFAWEVAEPACKEFGFWPDTISTDLHSFNLRGPVFDMPTTMSKFLYLGMPLPEVIRASTFAPAKAMRKEELLGSIELGKQADVVLLQLHNGKFPLTDVKGQVRTANYKLVPKRVCKRGVWHETNH